MEPVTLAVALIGSLLALVLRPIHSFCVFLVLLFCYSQMLTISIGSIDFTVARIVILAVLANALVIHGLWRKFRWTWMDTWVFASFFLMVYSLLQNAPAVKVIEREGGTFFNVMFPYIAARLILRSKSDLIAMCKTLAVMGIPLVFMGLYEWKTGINPMSFFIDEYAWGLGGPGGLADMRMGFYRASGTVGIHIIFGLIFAMIGPLTLGLWRQANWSPVRIGLVYGVLMLGLMSSMSSGPLFSIVITTAMLCCFPLRRFWPILAIAVIGSILFVEIFSNRHFYEVFDRFAFNKNTAYYRIGLLNEAFGGGMDGHWWFGYGYVGVGPGNDNTGFDWRHKDFVNMYVGKLARYGLVCLIPYLLANALYYRRLYKASKLARTVQDQWLIWCVSAALVGWNVSMMTVAPLRQINTLLFIMIAVAQNMEGMIRETAPRGVEELIIVKRIRRRTPSSEPIAGDASPQTS